ncbi:MAG: hypothetical protein ACT4P6_17540 [Gemmatimonadaceae bacterium]
MPLGYLAGQAGALRQGEIIGPVVLNRVRPDAPSDGVVADAIVPNVHPLMIVMHADCDLEQDFNHRASFAEGTAVDESHMRIVPETLLCDVFKASDFFDHLPKGDDLRKPIRKNQNERYHYMPESPVQNSADVLPPFLLDFKRTFMEQTASLYHSIAVGQTARKAVVPPIYVHDLMQRFFSFHARVGVPD